MEEEKNALRIGFKFICFKLYILDANGMLKQIDYNCVAVARVFYCR